MPLADPDPKQPKPVPLPAQTKRQVREEIHQGYIAYEAPPPDLNTRLPLTGETAKSWLLRRVGLVQKHYPTGQLKDVLSLASMHVTDKELERLARLTRIGERELPDIQVATAALPLAQTVEKGNPWGFLKAIGSGLAAAGSALASASEAVVGVGEAAVRKAGGLFDEGFAGTVGSIPEDIREGAKQVAGEAVEIFSGSAETVEKLARPITGPIATSAGYTARTITNKVQDLAALIDPTGTIKYTEGVGPLRLPKGPSPQEALRNALSQSPGENFAYDGLGLKRGSKEGKVVSGIYNFANDWIVFGAPGKVVKGLTLAETLPKGKALRPLIERGGKLYEVTDPSILNRLQTAAYNFRAKPARQLFTETKVGREMTSYTHRLALEGNKNRMLELMPQLDNTIVDELIEAAPQGEEAVAEVVIAAAEGRVLPIGRSRMLARLDEIDEEAGALVSGRGDPKALAEMGKLTREYDQVSRQLSRNVGKTVLRELPHPTLKRQLIDLAKRGSKEEGFSPAMRWVSRIMDKNWTRRVWTQLPDYNGIPIHNKDLGRLEFERWGSALKMPRKEIEDFTNQYLNANSESEMFDLFKALLVRGKETAKLSDEVAKEVLAMVDGSMRFEMAVDDIGHGVKWVTKVKAAPDRIPEEHPLPLFSSQIPDYLPVPNPEAVLQSVLLKKRFREILLKAQKQAGKVDKRGIAKEVRAAGGDKQAVEAAIAAAERSARLKGLGLAAARMPLDAYLMGQGYLSTFTSFMWKPAVLARFGWPVKVVALDEQWRMSAVGLTSLWRYPLEHLNPRRLREALKRAPDEVLLDYGKLSVQAKPANRILKHGNKGFGDALSAELKLMHAADEVAYMARHGKAKTRAWLESEDGAQVMAKMRPKIEGYAKSEGVPYEKAFDDWLDIVEGQVDNYGRNPALREALATGKIRIGGRLHQLDSRDTRDYLQRLSVAEGAPQAVRDTKPLFARWDQKAVAQGVRSIMRGLGSTPTNVLSRSPAFKQFYTRELDYLLSRGIDAKLAASSARKYAIERTNSLLYNLMSKTQFDKLHENLVPFFPAWKEVLKTWSYQIPNEIAGPLIGQMTLALRLKTLGELGQEVGALKKNKDGEWILDLGFYKTPLTRLAFFGTWPGVGPTWGKALGELSKLSETFERLLKPFFPYGPETTLGPQWINNLFTGLTGRPPWWEAMSQDFKQDQFTLIHLRQMQLRDKEIRRIGAMPDGEEKQAATQQLVEDSRRAAMGEYLARARNGFWLPAAPLRTHDSIEQLDAFRESIEGLPTGEKRSAYDELLAENPNLEFLLQARSYQVPGKPEAEKGRDAWFRALREGWVKVYEPETMANILVGLAEYDHARAIANEKIAAAGTTARDRLLNYNQIAEANIEKLTVIDELEDSNPDWARAFARSVGEDAKVLDAAEQREIETWKMLRILRGELKGQETDIDWKAVGTVIGQLGERVREYIEFTKSGEYAPGPQKTIAAYFESVFRPYSEQLNVLYSRLPEAKTSEDVSEIMNEVRLYRNSQVEQIVEGEVLPTPERVLFAMKAPEDQKATRVGWSMMPTEWLTKFQRETVGLGNEENASRFWDAINQERLSLRAWRRENGLSSSSKAYRDRKAALDAWEQRTAAQQGVVDEYRLSKALPYERLVQFRQIDSSPAWDAVVQTMNEVHGRMRARELLSFNNELGRFYAARVLPWLDAMRAADSDFADDIDVIRSVAPKDVQEGEAPWHTFWAYLFLTGKMFGVN